MVEHCALRHRKHGFADHKATEAVETGMRDNREIDDL